MDGHNQYTATEDSFYNYKLKAVKPIDASSQNILLAYENVIGTVSAKYDEINFFVDVVETFCEIFQPIYKSEKRIEDVVLSSDYRFIGIRRRNDKNVIVSIYRIIYIFNSNNLI